MRRTNCSRGTLLFLRSGNGCGDGKRRDSSMCDDEVIALDTVGMNRNGGRPN